MAQVTLRPDLKTSGGEVNDILCNGRFAGTLTLVYREHDRISGSIQLEEDSLPEQDKRYVIRFMQDYVQSFIDAVDAESCDVVVTYSPYERIFATSDDNPDDADDVFLEDDDGGLADEPAPVPDDFDYELVLTDERGDRLNYQIYDKDLNLLAEAVLRTGESKVAGEIHWRREPSDEEMEEITELVMSEFDEEAADRFELSHRVIGDEDLVEDEDYSAVLVRDDGDMLSYELYRQSRGGLTIGSATIDIQRRQLAGYVDFREKESIDDAGQIAAVLMRELDKEKEYERLNLTFLYRNEPVDEILFETERTH